MINIGIFLIQRVAIVRLDIKFVPEGRKPFAYYHLLHVAAAKLTLSGRSAHMSQNISNNLILSTTNLGCHHCGLQYCCRRGDNDTL